MRKRKLSQKFIIGIDEVGRGALAGPVTVAALVLPQNFHKIIRVNPLLKKEKFLPAGKQTRQFASIIRDSKKLTSRQREIWFSYIKKLSLSYRIASVSPKIIDKINVSQAANLAATRAIKKLIENYKSRRKVGTPTKASGLKTKNCKIFLDGGLFLNSKFCILNSTTVVRGDEKIPAISLASIVAKVHRDKLMKRLHKKYPRYDFINNVGYGTKKHIKALRKFGHSPIHRKTFHGVV